MSFILDALKKSETERQQKSSAEFAKVPSGGGSARVPGWLLLLGALLAINLVVLLGLLLRSPPEPQVVSTPTAAEAAVPAASVRLPETQPVPVAANAAPPSFADRLAEAKRNTPATATGNEAARETGSQQATAGPAVDRVPVANAAALPTIYEVVADGSVVLPELHLDIHVYSEVPQDRFVFINMSKQRENSQLEAGPVVDEITPDGVILTYRGTTFLLPRD